MRARVFLILSAVATSAITTLATIPPAVVADRTIDAAVGNPADLALSADGRLVAAAGATGYGIWDAQSGSSIRKDAAGAVARVAFAPQGNLLALGTADGRVGLVDLRTGERREVTKHNKGVRAIAFAPSGKMGASGDAEGAIQLWGADGTVAGTLKDGTKKNAIVFVGFSGDANLISLDDGMNVVTWDVAGKRAQRHGELQSGVVGRTIVPTSASLDASGSKLIVGGELISQPRGGALAGRNNLANPSDLRRDNMLIAYAVATGVSADPVITGDFKPETVAVSPGGCFALFTSSFRDQSRLHVWGLVEKGDDLVRTDLSKRATAVAMDAEGRSAAVATEAGQILTWRVSGITNGDCESYVRTKAPQNAASTEPKITLGSETSPLIQSGPGVRIAVLRFDAAGLSANLGQSVADMISGQLSNNPDITVIERSAIDAILKELSIQRSGLTQDDAVKIGKGLNAKTVLFGQVTRYGDDTYYVQVRAVSVESQRVIGSRDVQCDHCKEQNLPAAIAALQKLLVK
jgi:hypothetical protein